jgi:4-hydroxythreonine-4-phosphate dehydrogenase
MIAITMGDPTGIGPEIAVKTLARAAGRALCRPLLVGDPRVFVRAARTAGVELPMREVDDVARARFSPEVVDVLCPPEGRVGEWAFGQVDPAAADAAMRCLGYAFELALEGRVDGLVSTTLHKEAFHLASYDYSDELAYLEELASSRGLVAPGEARMLGVAAGIWTIAVTGHVPFRAIADLVTEERVLSAIVALHETLLRADAAGSRIGVAALNVHAGEGGLYGREELDEIGPAVARARSHGIEAHGPVPADAVFARALAGDFEGVVFMYHDQANIARKLQPRGTGATVFLGLPVPCATTAHGTAFDIAGRGIADPGSFEAALRVTAQLARG